MGARWGLKVICTGFAGQQAQLLLHLRVVAVLRHLVGPEAVVDLAILGAKRRLPSGAADPGLAVGDERIQVDQLILHQGGESQDDGRWGSSRGCPPGGPG